MKSTEEIIINLVRLGFSSYEAKVYLALVKKNPAIGYEISKIARVPAAKIYETLTKLKNKGAIIANNTDPVTYRPVPPDVLLKRLKNDFVNTIDDLEDKLQQIQPLPEIDFTWNISGYKTVLNKITNLISNSDKSLLLSIWPKEAELVKDYVVKSQNRGVKIIAGIFGDYDLGCKNTINLENCGASSQKRLGKRLMVVVGDSKEVVISEIDDKLIEVVGVWTTTPSIVLLAKEYIKHDIWGRVLIDFIGEEKFEKICEDNEMLSYIIKNR